MEVHSIKRLSIYILLLSTILLSTIPGVCAIGSYSECTCGAHSYGYWHEVEFVNYCPMCGYSGTLGVYYLSDGDSELHCYHCGSDFCAYDGWEKSGRFRAQLTVYTPKEPEHTKIIKKIVTQQDKLDVAKQVVNTHNEIL